jgi:tol-pal system protein YbgF
MRKMVVTFLIVILPVIAFAQRYGESDDFSYALKLYNEGFFDIAAQQFNIFVNRYPVSERVPEARYYLGLSLYRSGNYENARAEFQLMAVTFPDHSRAPEAWQKVGDCYIKLGKMEEAARAYETVKILYPQDPQAPLALYQSAKIYYDERLYDKAEMVLKDFLDRYPDSNNYPNGRLLYANLLMKKQNYDQALKEFDKVLTSGAASDLMAEAYLGIGGFYASLGQFERAIENYRVILSKYPTEATAFPALLAMSEVLTLSGQYEEAVKILNNNSMRFKTQAQKAQLNLQLAAIYFTQNDYFMARKTAESISLTGLSDTLAAKTRFYLAVSAAREQKYDLSLDNFRQLLEDSSLQSAAAPYRSEATKQRGYVFLKMKQYDRGSRELHIYMSNLGNTEKEKILADLFYAALESDRPDDAENVYHEILAASPHYAYRDNLLFELAKYRFYRGDYEQAKNLFQQFNHNYICSAQIDSARYYLRVISAYFVIDQKMGVNRLAKLMGRILVQEKTNELKLELARVYLLQLNDVNSSIEISRSLVNSPQDSSLTGEAYQVLAESYRRSADLKRFQHQNFSEDQAQCLEAYKNAMNYVAYVEFPDSLAFSFLKEMTREGVPETIPLEKQIQFWEHFRQSYTASKFAGKATYILAELYFKKRSADQALQILQTIINSKDQDLAGNAYYLMGKIYYEQKNQQEASRILKDFLLNIPVHSLRANGFGLLAKINENEGNFETAAAFWTKLREEYDYSPAALAARTRIPEIYLLAGQYQSVLNYTDPFIRETFPADLLLARLQEMSEPDFYFFNGKACFELQNDAAARKILLNYVYRQPGAKYYDEALFTLAEISLRSGDPDAALLHLQIITRNESSPFFLQATAKTADIYFERNDYEKAQVLYGKLIGRTADPDQKIQFQAREMICLINLGNLKLYESRLSAFSRNFKNNKNYDNYRADFEFEIGKYYYKNKNFDAAIKRFETVTGKFKKTEFADDAEYHLGLTYTTLNKVDKAMDVLSKFAEKYPASPLKANIYVTLGGLYYRAEKRELAVGAFQKAVEVAREPQTRQLALSNLILIYRDLGLWDGVLIQARTYAEEFPNAEDVIDKEIMIGSALINLNRYSEAVDFLKNLKFQANSEQEPEIQFYIGEAYFNGGQYENAIREFVKIPLLSKQTKLQWEASALYYSGQAYEKLGRKADAIRMYREIVERPGILVELKKEAQKRIDQLKES